jgi:protein-S-isoprenylcysteine O-methyltransferase
MRLPNPALLGAIYGLSEIALGLTRRSGGETRRRDRHSLALLWIVIAMSLIASWSIVFQGATLPHRRFFYFLGLLLFVGGVVLRWYAIVCLGRFFTVDVSIAEQHRVVDTGPYRFIRHPSYTGALVAFLGFGFCLGNYMSILWVMVPITLAFLWRIHVEERALLDALGDDYRQYMRRTRRLLPFVY